ncbi:S-4TM family putative pore-forming effector [Neolewinella litorea]|uniref:Uncharacterized protein n=1 Tax=Neolewinella litorea TaxID=2562452 RepID=A0A4S4NGN9_9BACT|nr:S-4TM family putative pore-forming effector [Neolewinella litorea]THH37817.1 hypothetical protein E4021_12310 [Neolewinella litorea]
MSIATKQNDDWSIKLLRAQRRSYNLAKRFALVDKALMFLSLISPAIIIYADRLQSIKTITIWTFVLIILSIVVKRFIKAHTNNGAIIQEMFDTRLFGLEWNDILIPKPILDSDIVSLSKKQDDKFLLNWYPVEIDQVPNKDVQILLCQRSTMAWDANIKARFILVYMLLFVLYYLLYIVIGTKNDLNLYEIILFAAPSFSFMRTSITEMIEISKQVQRQREVIQRTSNVIEKYSLDQHVEIKNSTLRQVQDSIYLNRVSRAKVPNWLYWLFRTDDENSMKMTVDSIVHKNK